MLPMVENERYAIKEISMIAHLLSWVMMLRETDKDSGLYRLEE